MLAASTILRAKLCQSDVSARTVTIRSQLMIIATTCCSAQLHTGSPRGVACTPTSPVTFNSGKGPDRHFLWRLYRFDRSFDSLPLLLVWFTSNSLLLLQGLMRTNSLLLPRKAFPTSRIYAWRMAQLVQVIESCPSRTTLTHL
jgi:hypothetical protein